jgi:putative tryptophan/tyrosine transport system substrate-binding protein
MTRYSRRQVVQGAGAVGLGLLAGCGRWPGLAQAPAKIARIGLLSISADPANPVVWLPFLDRMRELSYIEGQNVIIERGFGQGNVERLADLAADLARARVDIVAVTGPRETAAARAVMPTTPIVFMLVPDPVGDGIIDSLARPGGYVTGVTTLSTALMGKRLELLQEIVPGATRIGVLLDPTTPQSTGELREAQAAARSLALQLQVFPLRDPESLGTVFATMSQERVDALLVPNNPTLFNQPGRLVSLAMDAGLPAIYTQRVYVEAGGLMVYAPNQADLSSRAATYVDKILKGAKPADLPVEQPMRFDFIINLRTAQALGLTIPHHVLLQATEVIP